MIQAKTLAAVYIHTHTSNLLLNKIQKIRAKKALICYEINIKKDSIKLVYDTG